MTAATAEKKTKKQAPARLVDDHVGEEPVEVDATPLEKPRDVKDMEIILPKPGELIIQGVPCHVRRLKMREFFGLMGIMTAGLGPAMGQMGFESAGDAEEFGSLVVAGFIMAVPNQVPQFIVWMQQIVEPMGDKQQNREVHDYLDNPDPGELFPILDVILYQEKDNLFELMGKAKAYLARWQTMFTQK